MTKMVEKRSCVITFSSRGLPMSFVRKVFGASLSGAMIGSLLALMAPPTAVLAAQGGKCECQASGSGKYKCNPTSEKCLGGGLECIVKCK
jgi:hypothetical protein